MNRWVLSALVCVLMALLLAGCGKTEPLAPATEPPVTAAKAGASQGGWEQRWESVLGKAKREGRVSIYGGWEPGVRTAVTQAFGKKFGIDLEFTPFSRGAEMVARVQQEKAAGLNVADVYGQGGGTLMTSMKPLGYLGPIEPLLILPEVLDPAAWTGGKFPWYDKDQRAIGMLASIMRPVFYNSELIKEGEITTVKDLLKPQYKGKIVINDPTYTGVGNAMFNQLVHWAWNEAEASDFLRRLIREQEGVVIRDGRLQAEWVARGKHAIGFGAEPGDIVPFIRAGAPIKVAYTREGAQSSSVGGAMAVPVASPHPNATIVFVNWILSKEGQTIFAENWGMLSVRADVTVKSVEPMLLLRPDEKLIVATEEITLMKEKDRELAKRIIDEATR